MIVECFDYDRGVVGIWRRIVGGVGGAREREIERGWGERQREGREK